MVEISVENSVEVNLLPVNNNSEVSADLINNSEENNEVPTVTDFIDFNNIEGTVTASYFEETGEVSTAKNTVNNNQIDPKSMKV